VDPLSAPPIGQSVLLRDDGVEKRRLKGVHPSGGL
jgi:hypothetical protein